MYAGVRADVGGLLLDFVLFSDSDYQVMTNLNTKRQLAYNLYQSYTEA
jgi:hypothetical protein